MFRILPALALLLLLSACSSQRDVLIPDRESTQLVFNEDADPRELALEHFINGATAEAKGDFASAILEYQDAIQFDPSSGIYYALAKNYFNLNKLSLALQNSRKAIELDSSNADYYDLLADIYSAAHQNDSAAIVLEKILLIDSTRMPAYYQLARMYEEPRPVQAITIYEKILKIIGPEWSVLTRLAELNEKLGNNDKAADNIKELLSLDPANISLQKVLIDFYVRTKMYDDAIIIIDDIIELTPDDMEARERKAQIYLEQGKWAEASKEYGYILEQPDIPLEVKVRIGGAYFNQSLRDSTLLPITKSFFEKMDKDTLDWQIKMYLGAIAVNERNDSAAIKNFKFVTDLARWNSEAWIRLGGLYFDNQKYDEAAKVMGEAVESFPDNFAVNLILGLSLSQDDNHSDARQYLKKAAELNPNDVTALSAYGFTLNRLKENDEAIVYMKRALSVDPDNVNLLGTLGLIYDSMEMWAECDSIYESALKIDSVNALVNNNYAYSLSERNIQLERALKMVQIAVKADSLNSSYLDTMGWVYFKLGNYDMAKLYIEKAIEAGGESAVMLEHLGDIVFKLGEKESALQLWEKSFDLDPTNEKLKLKIEKGEI
ncbi:MAG: tetratricopeptide repeat protein [Ignavibacteriaceae bacterium]